MYDEITVHVKGRQHPLRFREQTRGTYLYATQAVLNGTGFILKSDDLGEFAFGPGMVTHVHSYIGKN